MPLWEIGLVIAGAGGLGGVINAFTRASGFKLPKAKDGLIEVGFFGHIIAGAAAAFVSWGLYGQYAGYRIIGATNATPAKGYSESLAAITGAFLVGMAGTRYLSAEVDKKTLQRTASLAAGADASPELAAFIATSTPAAALRAVGGAMPGDKITTAEPPPANDPKTRELRRKRKSPLTEPPGHREREKP